MGDSRHLGLLKKGTPRAIRGYFEPGRGTQKKDMKTSKTGEWGVN